MDNRNMKDFWSGDVGARWVSMADFLDAGFANVTRAVIARAAPLDGLSVLDVGCGAGALSRAAAARADHVIGLDISPTMLAAARKNAPPNARFVEADAQIGPIPGAPYDAAISQFGLMFFADTVAALAQIRAACRPGTRLTFATWGATEDNPWFRVPREFAVAATGPVDNDPDAPGPMRMRDIDTVTGWLDAAGWRSATGEALNLTLPLPGTLETVAFMSTRVGGASSVLAHHEADKPTRRAVSQAIADAFAVYARDGAVHVPATVNLFTATA